jgi:uncharacterized membrane protein (DUF2068 family)
MDDSIKFVAQASRLCFFVTILTFMPDTSNPKRPKLITVLAVMQFLFAVIYLIGVVKIFAVMFSDEVQNNKSLSATLQGLNIGAVACVVWMLLTYVSARGLWCMKNWARWLALFANGFIAITLMYSNFDDWQHQSIDMDDVIAMLLFLLPVIPFTLPVVGRALKFQVAPEMAISTMVNNQEK